MANKELVEVELSDKELVEKKMFLEQCELAKDESDLQLEKMLKQMEKRIPVRILEESIEQLKKDIKDKKVRRRDETGEFTEDATDVDMDMMEIELESQKKMLKADIQMRDLRFKIQQMQQQKKRDDSPDLQIPKLKREIREHKATMLKERAIKEGKIPEPLPTFVG